MLSEIEMDSQQYYGNNFHNNSLYLDLEFSTHTHTCRKCTEPPFRPAVYTHDRELNPDHYVIPWANGLW